MGGTAILIAVAFGVATLIAVGVSIAVAELDDQPRPAGREEGCPS